MSSTQIFVVPKEGPVFHSADVGNSWRGAMFVWTSLKDKYILKGREETDIDWLKNGQNNDPFGLKGVWELSEGDQLLDYEKAVLMSTYDWVICEADKIPLFVSYLIKFAEVYGEGNLLEQADVLNQIYEVILECKDSDEVVGVCWNQNSVVVDLWTVGQDEEDELIWYDYSKHNEEYGWFLFERMNNVEND